MTDGGSAVQWSANTRESLSHLAERSERAQRVGGEGISILHTLWGSTELEIQNRMSSTAPARAIRPERLLSMVPENAVRSRARAFRLA